MVKRRRNNIGQFISSASIYTGQKEMLFHKTWFQKSITFFMALLFIFIASPWITLAIKSKNLQFWIYALLKFYRRHFVSDDEYSSGYCTSTNKEDI